jgi:hypothetical protein
MSLHSDIAALNNVGWFQGGNTAQCNHLNKVVDVLNGIVDAATNNAEDVPIVLPPDQDVDIWVNGQRMVLTLSGNITPA